MTETVKWCLAVYVVYNNGTYLHSHDLRIESREVCERIALSYDGRSLFAGCVAIMIAPFVPC
jgi:hypothetical protein